MDTAVTAAIDAWLNEPAIAEPDKQEIRDLIALGDEKELTDRFYRDLEFGTGGMRGVIAAGLNRMNVYTVGAAAQGLANYIRKRGPEAMKAGVAIAYDCRNKSDVFALRTASVMAGNGITAYLFERLRPTPELSFAVRHLGCAAGVVITASHNPPEYNGFKVYGADGCQVIAPEDEAIIREVRSVGGFGNVKTMDPKEAGEEGLIKIIGGNVDGPFLEAVQGTILNRAACQAMGKTLKIVYTPLHGTGVTLIPEALRRRGFEKVIVVPEQAEPNGDFPTVAYPNPEEPAAFQLGIELAKKEDADLVIATDPDADRMGLAVATEDDQFELLTGNQIMALLTWYVCEQRKKTAKLPPNAVVISTIVSGDLMKEIARSYGVEVVEVLTGFKYIGAKIREYEQAGDPGAPSKVYVFGGEESYGYMPATFTRDKDAVTSTALVAEMAAMAAEQGLSLYDVLVRLFEQFGYFQEGTKNITLKGKEGAEKIQAIMASLRASPPAAFAGVAVKTIADLQTGEIKDARTGKIVGKYDLPSSNVMLFTLDDGTKVIGRPSGTEPKIKFYVLVREPGDDLVKARAAATAKIDAIYAQIDELAK
ncbi:MAG TPA: phospho-sugar mutase [Phycisphaerae bacterium]|nr:phospho-sugar mutase [Phycisphaerae bacterium]HOJ72319.1 phospho-sugar mutase [Phycisphaerae bacterium]HOM50019.1 phospho-sugar mutase [Phycisphaerae bacterium]HON65336.1 phospho-sugar mutase [Phycisphaerae bacterium]HOQ84733.1 phospho-sugar mutase [Phycisphaerae bacterium]